MRIGVVLSAGGLRGVAHLGVMRRLVAAKVPIDVLVGVSAGAIVGGFYAGVGLTIEDMVAHAPRFKGRHVVMHGLTLRAPAPLKPLLRSACGIIPVRLSQLEQASFEHLHHGVTALGVVCHDQLRGTPVYFATGATHGARFADVVKASAAVPGLMPPREMAIETRRVRLVDGGLSDALPMAFARQLGATHLVVSDCRATSSSPSFGMDVLYVRPSLDQLHTWRSPAGTLMEAVRLGEAAVREEHVDRIDAWRSSGAVLGSPPVSAA